MSKKPELKTYEEGEEKPEESLPDGNVQQPEALEEWKKKLEELPAGGGNFRQRAENVGVPPENVKDFKYWLREQHGQHEQAEQHEQS